MPHYCSNIAAVKNTKKMKQTKILKRNAKILSDYQGMIANGSLKMDAYNVLAKRYRLSVGGIRHAILCARDMQRTPAPAYQEW